AGITLTGNGGLDIAGLEWLGARAYDPTTRGFLSTDPLAPVLGAGWDGNPYAYAGNNPLNTTDPTGLRPLTDEELKAYDGSSRGAFAAAGNWINENKEYIAAAVLVAAGVALMCTGVGGPVGLVLLGAASGALVSAGASIGMQKAATGTVNWGHVGRDALIGGAAGAVGGCFWCQQGRFRRVERRFACRIFRDLGDFTRQRGGREVCVGVAKTADGQVCSYQWNIRGCGEHWNVLCDESPERLVNKGCLRCTYQRRRQRGSGVPRRAPRRPSEWPSFKVG
ncbi:MULTISPECIES: RHS repeat-associated core domain-containing protein, partial [unclassified Arthrobacter]|uniref:RHS repeat-associated core domain-containing protein n=1 Tax=unclassified Arthrobacter TaxID=235627 RepID=UPI002DFB8460